MDMADEFGHGEIQQGLARVKFLLCVEVLQLLLACVDIHLDTY